MLARQAVEERLEKKIAQRMDEKQQEYVQEIKMQLIKEELQIVNAPNEKKLDDLDHLDTRPPTDQSCSRVGPEIIQPLLVRTEP